MTLAQDRDWRVTGLARADDEKFVRGLGADFTTESARAWDAVADGAALQEQGLTLVRDGGLFVGVQPGAAPAEERGVTVRVLVARPDGALTVLSLLSTTGEHVIVVDEGALMFGLLVDEVTEVSNIDDARIGPPPQGQAGTTVAGVIHEDGGLVLVLDAAALRGTLSR